MKRKTDNFSKFFNRKRTSAVKEEIRQEKKLVKKERREAVDRHFEEKRNKRAVSTSLPTEPGKEQKAGGLGAKIPVNKTIVLPHNKKSAVVPNDKGLAASQNDIAANNNRASIPQNNAITLPLNKYVAHAGVSSRRASAILVKEGKVTVNGIVVTDPGTKVLYTDTVKVNGKKVTVSSHFVYILLNKPKDFLTTTTDPQGRKTVQQLISKATEERVYPIGRLDRNTSGVLLFTNDGDLAQKLSHPKNEMKKVYHAGLDKPLTRQHFEKIMGGIELEDGLAKVDEMAYADPKDKTQIGLEIHSGKNRIVRRIFAALGYDVKTLDRVMYAGLTKKNVQRGNWRFLTEKEIRALKYLKS